MGEIEEYASQWDESAKYFFDKKYYSWMCDKVSQFPSVLEVGCGTGYSTLVLVEKGHKVIAIDKNNACINAAKQRIAQYGYEDKVIFLKGDITDHLFKEEITQNYQYDVVICWNIGTYWNKEILQHYVPYMLEYGLDINQIRQNLESSYSELIIWDTCKLANSKNKPIHIIERGMEFIDKNSDPYYCKLKDEFDYSTISYENYPATTLSNGGRILSINGNPYGEQYINILLISVLIQ